MSPKEALLKIDTLIESGDKLLQHMEVENYYYHQEAVLAGMKERKKKRHCEDEFNEWLKEVKEVIQEIFQDYTPLHKFQEAFVYWKDTPYPLSGIFADTFGMIDFIKKKLKNLVEFYDRIEHFCKSPLMYIPDKALLCFYDFVIELVADTNEAELCRYMFQFDFGKEVPFGDIYDYIQGKELKKGESDKKDWLTIVKSAYTGVNRKTNERFGFPIFTKDKRVLRLGIPNHFVTSLK